MENQIQLFTNQLFGNIRVLSIKGEPWFIGKDIALALGYVDTINALKQHIEKVDKDKVKLKTKGGPQTMTIINESGLYSLMMKSRMPLAKEIDFKKWLSNEIVPTVREFYTDNPLNMVRESYIKNNSDT